MTWQEPANLTEALEWIEQRFDVQIELPQFADHDANALNQQLAELRSWQARVEDERLREVRRAGRRSLQKKAQRQARKRQRKAA